MEPRCAAHPDRPAAGTCERCGALALLLSGIGLSRVDPDAFPPIGRKRQAIAGIVIGAIGTAGWGAFLLATWRH